MLHLNVIKQMKIKTTVIKDLSPDRKKPSEWLRPKLSPTTGRAYTLITTSDNWVLLAHLGVLRNLLDIYLTETFPHWPQEIRL